MDGKKYIFGIDLGTTYSCISYVDETGRPVVVKNAEGDNITPSVVNFADSSTVVVGQAAKDTAVTDPDHTVAFVKRLMGRTKEAIQYNGVSKSPEEVSSYIVRKLAEDASLNLNTEVKDVVITCPAYFGTTEREATKNAGIIAGLNVIEIINEPTAAALYYGCSKSEGEKTVLVYDLGGGTFDVTVMRIGEGKIQVVCSDGDHELGGKDWDEKLMEYVWNKFVDKVDFQGDAEAEDTQALRLNVEKAKKQLSAKSKVSVIVQAGSDREKIEVTQEEFDSLTKPNLDMTIVKTDAAIKAAKDKGFTIDEILLVGGSTRMPQVSRILQSKYNVTPLIVDPDEAVAKGAALYALGVYENKHEEYKAKEARGDALDGDAANYIEAASASTASVPSLHGKTMKEVVTVAATKSYAVAANDPISRKIYCYNMILKNTPMENGVISQTQSFGAPGGTKTLIGVYESDVLEERYEPREELKLGEAVLDFKKVVPLGNEVTVTLTLNNEGLLEVYGFESSSNTSVRATMHASRKNIMSADDVALLKDKSKGISIE